jgi:hypothetical protein
MFSETGLMIFALIAAVCGSVMEARKAAIAVALAGIATGFIPSLAPTLPFAFPFMIVAGALGLATGHFVRKKQALVAILPIAPVFALWGYSMMVESRGSNEWERATEFVKNNDQVARAAGGIKDVYPDSILANRDGTVRFLFSVYGEKHITAVVKVSRSPTPTEFALQCVSHLSSGKRDSSKDVCEQ